MVRVYSYDEPVSSGSSREGWAQPVPGTGRNQGIQIQRFFETFKALLQRAPRALLIPWVVTMAVDLLFVAASVMLIFIFGGPRPWERMPMGVSASV